VSHDADGSASAERGLVGAAAGVATFDEEQPGAVRRLQNFFHQYPTSIPAIILILAVIVFGFVTGGQRSEDDQRAGEQGRVGHHHDATASFDQRLCRHRVIREETAGEQQEQVASRRCQSTGSQLVG